MAWSGTVVPSGSLPLPPPCDESAVAVLVRVRLVVQAPESRASGTNAVAFCQRVRLLRDGIVCCSLPRSVCPPSPQPPEDYPVTPSSNHPNEVRRARVTHG